jgi:nitronate monooxygenase
LLPIKLKSIINKLNISGKNVWPIIEGGKGIGISNGTTAGHFAKAGAVGTFSGANPQLIDENGELVKLIYKTKTRREKHEELIEYSIRGGISQAQIASEIDKNENGRIHMNILWEMGGAIRVLEGILKGAKNGAKNLIHGVTAGAGMPYKLAEITSKNNVFYYPIVSSMRAFAVLWKRAYSEFSKFLGGVVYEDPWLAGGHNGLSNKEDPLKPLDPKARLIELRKFMNECNLQHVPIVMAGGVWHLKDWTEYIDNPEIGLVAFQFGTRPLLTRESPILKKWGKKLLSLKEGDIMLNKFSPTGFYSSAVKNAFIKNLVERSERQIKYSDRETENLNYRFVYNKNLDRAIFIAEGDSEKAKNWVNQGFSEIMKTPDETVIFVTPSEKQQITKDQIDCMGCLSHCRFSNWKDHDDYTTGQKPDPRSYCIQKTLQAALTDNDIENELMFSGHNAFKFGQDEFYKNGFIPTIDELVQKILTGL